MDEICIAFSLAQKLAYWGTKRLSERMNPEKRDRLQSVLYKLQNGTRHILLALAKMEQSRLHLGYFQLKLAITELQHSLPELSTFDGNLLLNIQSLANLETARYYHLAKDHLEKAEFEAGAVLTSNLADVDLQIEALGICIFCQIVLHPDEPKIWFKLWLRTFEAFFMDMNRVKAALGKPSLISSKYKETKERMKILMKSLLALIFDMVLNDLSLANDAINFINRFNGLVIAASSKVSEMRPTQDWKPLHLEFKRTTKGVSWVTNDSNRGAVGVLLESDIKFMYLNGLDRLTWVAPNLVYGVTSSGELVSVDPSVASRNLTTTTGKWEILGYAGEQNLLYASDGGKIFLFDITTNNLRIDQTRVLPVFNTHARDYNFLVAANGSMLAYNKTTHQRHVHFSGHGSEWLHIDDSNKPKNHSVVLHSGDQLLLRKDKENYIIRLSLIASPNKAKLHIIQKEKIYLKKSNVICEYHSFDIRIEFDFGFLTTNVMRLCRDEGPEHKYIYIVGQGCHDVQSGASSLLDITKPKGAKFEIKISHIGLSIAGFIPIEDWEAATPSDWPPKKLQSVTYGDGTIFV